jgi:hypothetical protein
MRLRTTCLLLSTTALAVPALGANPTILITGFWPPTNNMLRPWRPSPAQNPGGWIGSNWEGRGYDIKSYFPEFPGQTGPSWGKGSGDMEVDYQDVAADFARLTNETKPVAIITFSRANTSIGWELEPAYQRWRLPGESIPVGGRNVPTYSPDYDGVTTPTNTPIASEPLGNIRFSNLPMQSIVNAVAAGMPASSVSPFIDAFNATSTSSSAFGGNFVSGYTGYLGTWYKDLNGPGTANPVYAAGHIHIGTNLDATVGTQATGITLRTLTAYLDTVIPAPASTAALGLGVLMLCRRRR